MMTQKKQNYRYISFLSNSAWYIYAHRWDVILYFMANNYRILIIAPQDRPVPAFEHPAIKYIALQFNNKSLNVFASVGFYIKVKKIYQQYQPVAAFHYAIKANIFGNMAAKGSCTPCISVIIGTGHAFSKKNWLFKIAKVLYTYSLKWPKEVWLLNEEDGDFFIQQKMVSKQKVRILNGEGVNLSHYNPNDWMKLNHRPFTFIITTRFLYSKGIGTIAAAISLLKTSGYPLKCLLLGDSDEGHPDNISQKAIEVWKREGIFEHVPFVDDVRPWLAQSDCFLLPSYYNEGLPRCLMEAASMELPIITSKQKGCKETVIDGISGFLCQANNADDLALKMKNILDMPNEQLVAMGKAGRLLMQQKFSVDKICRIYLEVIKNFKLPN